MSLIALAWGAHPDYPVVLVMNRDERHARPTAYAAWHAGEPAWLGGKDLEQGGTWFGVTRQGRFAALTNFRDATPSDPAAPSRGQLPMNFLKAQEEPLVHARGFSRTRPGCAPFSLLLGSPRQIYFVATRARVPLALTPGIHTLANGLIDEPWPKTERAEVLLGAYMRTHGGFAMLLGAYSKLSETPVQGADHPLCRAVPAGPADFAAAVFAMLADRATTPIGLPDTGIGRAEEERLSACFVTGSESGTRSSSALVMARSGQVYFEERAFGGDGEEVSRVVEQWTIDPAVFSAGNGNE